MRPMSLPAFNRILSRYLASSLHAGIACDEALVLQCYSRAARAVPLPGRGDDDLLTMEIRRMCVDHDLQALRQHQLRLRQMSPQDAETEIYRLLNPELRVAGTAGHDADPYCSEVDQVD